MLLLLSPPQYYIRIIARARLVQNWQAPFLALNRGSLLAPKHSLILPDFPEAILDIDVYNFGGSS
jgi:hypothetical protein